ncbi:hypothetical protein [Allorhizocola rhizosphaerae]|uniref:hypothetical protein n=1 Tax=Allorhizocola rhizosphaerae TaxID=1872709 RepID=UPI000E3C68EE|nr:hypothetical protein [Allorhizocola rhizosphaerae]
MTKLRVIIALFVLITASACTEETPASTPPSTGPGAGPTATGGPAQAYRSKPLDLCQRTDLAPLTELSLKVESTNPEPPPSGPGSACLWKMKSASGHMASLRVEAVTQGSVDAAQAAFKGQQDVSAMRGDGDIPGLGDQAEGRTQDSEPGFKQSEYMIHMRAGNMTLKVWISVGGNAFTPKDSLKDKMIKLMRTTLATVSEEWKTS